MRKPPERQALENHHAAENELQARMAPARLDSGFKRRGGVIGISDAGATKSQRSTPASERPRKAFSHRSTQAMENEITPSSGNVFEDLGFEGGEAENLRVRARLMAPLERYVKERDLTQMEAAKELDTTQARISELVNGKVQAFSIDALVNMLNRAGLEVDVNVRPKTS